LFLIFNCPKIKYFRLREPAILFEMAKDNLLFKGTGTPDRFQIFWQKCTYLGLNKGCGWFLNWSSLFYIKIKVFRPVNAQLCRLDNVSGVPGANFSLLLYWSSGCGTFLQALPGLPFASHWRKDFVGGYANGRENLLKRRHSLSVRHLQQAINLYYGSIIFHVWLSEEPRKKCKNHPQPLFRPRYIHTFPQ
jgi:hypothetical protein